MFIQQHHNLKCERIYFEAILRGDKKFEIRKNDRNYKIGDMIYFTEVVNGVPTGEGIVSEEIQYIFEGGKYGLEEGYCIFNW